MNESGKVLTALAIGAAAGLIAGLLIAPDKGSVTRKRIADTSKKVSDKVMQYADAGSNAVTNIKKRLHKETNGANAEFAAEETVW